MVNHRNISFSITYDQAETICEHFGKNINDMSEVEICELLDNLIDEAYETDMEE